MFVKVGSDFNQKVPPIFRIRFAKCAARKEVVFAPPARAHTTINSLVKIKEMMYPNNMITI
jgi:hypothetical protein